MGKECRKLALHFEELTTGDARSNWNENPERDEGRIVRQAGNNVTNPG